MSKIKPLDSRVRTFGYRLGAQSPRSAALKVRYEAEELVASFDETYQTPDRCLNEAADVLITLIGYLYRSGVSWKRLVRVANAKMAVNESRVWVTQPDGTYQHRKDEG